MFTGVMRFLVSCGAETSFDNARIQATYSGDTEPPKDKHIENSVILKSLKGENDEYNSKQAFASLLGKLRMKLIEENSWVFIIKTLILIDRMVDQQILLKEFNQLNFSYVENRKETFPEPKNLSIDELISCYYKFIKMKCHHYYKDPSSLTCSKGEKKEFLEKLSAFQLLQEMNMISELFEYGFELANTDKRGHLRYKVNQYVFLLLLKDFLKLYSSTMICLSLLLSKIVQMGLEQIVIFKQLLNPFHNYCEQLIFFIASHRYINGFADIDIDEIQKIDCNLIDHISQFQKVLQQQKIASLDYPNEQNYKSNDDILVFQERKNRSQECLIQKGQVQYYIPKSSKTISFDIKMQTIISQDSRFEINMQIFDAELFNDMQNNYQSDYVAIDEKYKKQYFIQNNESIGESLIIINDYLVRGLYWNDFFGKLAQDMKRDFQVNNLEANSYRMLKVQQTFEDLWHLMSKYLKVSRASTNLVVDIRIIQLKASKRSTMQ